MKSIVHKILSIALVFVVLFSTMSFTINMHYCGGSLMDTAIFSKVETCGMKMENPLSGGCSITKMNCCDDKSLVVDGQDELKLSVDKISFEQQVFIASFVYTYINLFEGLDKNVSSYEEYKPPLVIRQIYKIDETYLI
ncbi:hypothetical protein MWU58_05255 [Flavobacteriaceae bacterium S0825]|uniref:HYC_CC_PP family protein n=1 Tax=Gaetbulibacter sp. S0825 TaxID=2720084 RepID=UPI00142FDDE7|nr:hypothetical protein [Gaetbulibacter sp. S0825]MCK0108689.1 hypothetical protein [Flavobacteriaceae bacterium S0825]NIX64325.1 hypothetical protein [Gaetbulibacter sp. S0825]